MQQFWLLHMMNYVVTLLMKVYKSSLPLVDEPQTFESLDGGSSRDLFHTTNTTTNTWIKIVGRELYGYRQYHFDANICKCVLIWWQIKEHKFPTIINLARQILSIPANQIEIEWIFSIVNILIALCNQIEIEWIFSIVNILIALCKFAFK